jgi:hypothetical protein
MFEQLSRFAFRIHNTREFQPSSHVFISSLGCDLVHHSTRHG